jgi:hypothetical protein
MTTTHTAAADLALSALAAGLAAAGTPIFPGSGLTAQPARWASQHDWYQGVTGEPHTGLTVYVNDEPHAFRDFAALRMWAGY